MAPWSTENALTYYSGCYLLPQLEFTALQSTMDMPMVSPTSSSNLLMVMVSSAVKTQTKTFQICTIFWQLMTHCILKQCASRNAHLKSKTLLIVIPPPRLEATCARKRSPRTGQAISVMEQTEYSTVSAFLTMTSFHKISTPTLSTT